MRRKDRAITYFDEIISILERCKVIHLAMISDGVPYSVPVNFGYLVTEQKKVLIFFHGAGEGKKVSALKTNPKVSFSCVADAYVDSNYADKSVACRWTCYYESVIGFGKVRFLEKLEEKTIGLDRIMLHNGYKIPAGLKNIMYNTMKLAHTSVGVIEVDEITGKRNKKRV